MSWLLFGVFAALMCAAVPLAVALGLSATAVIVAAKMGIMSVPTTVYSGIAKYPLIALPVFILAGMIFERSGVAARLVRLAEAMVGKRAGGLAIAAVLVCMVLGGISGSGPADAAAVGRQDRAHDEVGRRRGEERNRGRDVRRSADAPQAGSPP